MARLVRITRVRASQSADSQPLDEVLMLDVLMLAIALGFFVVALGYVIACDRM